MLERRKRRQRREVLTADLNGCDATTALWCADEELSTTRTLLLVAVREAVASALTDKQREVVEAHFFEGLSQGEVARRLGITQQVVQKRLYGVERRGKRIGGAIARLHEALAPTFGS